MSTTRVHSESGLEVRRVGPAGQGSAVLVVTAPGTSVDAVTRPVASPFTRLVLERGASVYWVVWAPLGPEHAHIGEDHLVETVLPRVLRRVVRDAAASGQGQLHVVGLGQGGRLVAQALSTVPSELPGGALVLCGAVVAPERSPVTRRSAQLWSDGRLRGHRVPSAITRLGSAWLSGPSGWQRTVLQLLEGDLDEPLSGTDSGALLVASAEPASWSRSLRRPTLILAGADDPRRTPATCFPAARAIHAPCRTLVVPGAHPPLSQLLRHAALVMRHLDGASA